MSDLSTIRGIMHHQKLQILHIVHNELIKSVGKHMLGSSVGTITNVGHQSSTAETTSTTSINTLRLSPVLLDNITRKNISYIHSLEFISLETRKRSQLLLYNLHFANRTHFYKHR